jgi:preprotein translocase subunit SecD
MKPIVPLISVCLMVLTTAVANPAPAPVFQLRLVDLEPSDQAERMVLVHKTKEVTYNEVLYVQKEVLLDQSALRSAEAVNAKPPKRPTITITFTNAGRKEFADVTRQNLGKRLAIVIGGALLTAPTIRSEIADGKAVITGSFTYAEAKDMARKITAALSKR